MGATLRGVPQPTLQAMLRGSRGTLVIKGSTLSTLAMLPAVMVCCLPFQAQLSARLLVLMDVHPTCLGA